MCHANKDTGNTLPGLENPSFWLATSESRPRVKVHLTFEKSTSPNIRGLFRREPLPLALPYFRIFENAGDLDADGAYTPAVSFGFDGLECSAACEVSTSTEAVGAGSSSDGSMDRTTAIVIGSVASGAGLAALIVIWAVLMRRRKSKEVIGIEPAANGAPTDPNAPVPVPVFEVRTKIGRARCCAAVGLPGSRFKREVCHEHSLSFYQLKKDFFLNRNFAVREN